MIQSVESRESFCKGWGGITNEPTYFENCVHYIFFFSIHTCTYAQGWRCISIMAEVTECILKTSWKQLEKVEKKLSQDKLNNKSLLANYHSSLPVDFDHPLLLP